MQLKCSCCGEFFYKFKKDINRNLKTGNINMFCSNKCSTSSRSVSTLVICNCTNCGKEFSRRIKEPLDSSNIFCSKSCSTTYTNKQTPRRKKSKLCKCCGSLINANITFCKPCQIELKHLHITLNLNDAKTDKTRRKILIKTNGHQCEICNNTEWNNKPITLELDHIDGDSDNNKESNLRIICPNCHSQTPYHKGANKGRGNTKRKQYRRLRYIEGKPC